MTSDARRPKRGLFYWYLGKGQQTIRPRPIPDWDEIISQYDECGHLDSQSIADRLRCDAGFGETKIPEQAAKLLSLYFSGAITQPSNAPPRSLVRKHMLDVVYTEYRALRAEGLKPVEALREVSPDACKALCITEETLGRYLRDRERN